MPFQSILYPGVRDRSVSQSVEEPEYFRDLNLDQLVETITRDTKSQDLRELYYLPLQSLDEISYRQEIARDLESEDVMRVASEFSREIRSIENALTQAKKLKDYQWAKAREILDSALAYCEVVRRVHEDLISVNPHSDGLKEFLQYLNAYLRSELFRTLALYAGKVASALSTVQYCLLLKDGAVTVRRYEEEEDQTTEVERVFEKFRRMLVIDRRLQVRERFGMNHVEAQIQERVARLFPDAFQSLEQFCTEHLDFLDDAIVGFGREIRFYISYLIYVQKLRSAGLSFCYPEMQQTSDSLFGKHAFDAALASKLIPLKKTIVCNDFYLANQERIFVVTGPNQGGKTTFARMIGQLHYLACMGLPVPGSAARLMIFSRVFTHFEREESISNLQGKLQDDLVRIHEILCRATPNTIVVINEIFSSTTFGDALFLSEKVMEVISRLNVFCVWVTFIDELATLNEKPVSMVSCVDPANPEVRTFKIERHAADGLAYALALAEKHRVTYQALKERITE
jgi:DNA mismatch repair ATPase MutS